MLDLDDDFVCRSGIPEVDPAIFASFEAFDPDTLMPLKKVPGEDLQIIRRQLIKVVVEHGSAQVSGRGEGENSIIRPELTANRKALASLVRRQDRLRARG
jgi:hypothetical protein